MSNFIYYYIIILYMRIGFIVGKDEEVYNDEYLFNLTPKKYLVDDELHTDSTLNEWIKLNV